MADNIKAIGFNRSMVSNDVAKVLDVLIANLPRNTRTVEKLSSTATLADVILKLNELIDKTNDNATKNKLSNLTYN